MKGVCAHCGGKLVRMDESEEVFDEDFGRTVVYHSRCEDCNGLVGDAKEVKSGLSG